VSNGLQIEEAERLVSVATLASRTSSVLEKLRDSAGAPDLMIAANQLSRSARLRSSWAEPQLQYAMPRKTVGFQSLRGMTTTGANDIRWHS
jgi:hypothetical protein